MLLPTTTSWVPKVNQRPSLRTTWGRSSFASGETPRTEMFPMSFEPFLDRLMTTKVSVEAKGFPFGSRATSGSVLMMLA